MLKTFGLSRGVALLFVGTSVFAAGVSHFAAVVIFCLAFLTGGVVIGDKTYTMPRRVNLPGVVGFDAEGIPPASLAPLMFAKQWGIAPGGLKQMKILKIENVESVAQLRNGERALGRPATAEDLAKIVVDKQVRLLSHAQSIAEQLGLKVDKVSVTMGEKMKWFAVLQYWEKRQPAGPVRRLLMSVHDEISKREGIGPEEIVRVGFDINIDLKK